MAFAVIRTHICLEKLDRLVVGNCFASPFDILPGVYV